MLSFKCSFTETFSINEESQFYLTLFSKTENFGNDQNYMFYRAQRISCNHVEPMVDAPYCEGEEGVCGQEEDVFDDTSTFRVRIISFSTVHGTYTIRW